MASLFRPLSFLLALVMAVIASGAISAEGPVYQPPHAKPGPAVERVRFRAFHTDIASRELRAGSMDLYVYGLKTEAAKALEGVPGVRLYQAPATSLSLVLNPAPAPEGELNPFSLREVRVALQYIVNREFIAQEIYKGLARPMLSHVSPFDFDYLLVSDLLREEGITYDPQLARDMVSRAMTAAGAVLKDDVWHFRDRPIRLNFVIRVEDERRDIGDLVRVELEKLGFQVAPVYHAFAPAILRVYGTDPQLFEWHLYTEGWGRGAPERYDYATINQMCAPWLGNMPGWQEVGYWQYQHPRLDELGQRLFRGAFKTPEERAQLYREATGLALEESVRIWLVTVVNTFPAAATLEGVTEDIVSGPKSLWTLREARLPGKEELTVGSLWVWTERSTWNPIAGFGDVYSVDIWRNVHDPPLARHPFTGLPIPFRANHQVETAGPEGKLEVPADAFLWDAAAGEFRPVAPGTRAISKVTLDYSGYFSSRWHHDQPITMADVVYSIFQSFDLAFNQDKSRIEFAIATTSRPYLESFRGFRILDDNSLEVYVDFWHFVPDYIAEYASLPGLSMPWELLAAMDHLVFVQRRAAYSDTAAQRFGVPWLNLVMDRDARLVRRTLLEFQEEGFVPEKAFRVGDRSLVSEEEALARYRAALSWFDAYGILVISNGPFKLVRFDPPAQYAELEAFRDPTYPFKPGQWYFGAPPALQFGTLHAPPIEIGSRAEVEVKVEGPGELGLRYLLYDPATARVLKVGDAEKRGPAAFAVVFSPEETAALKLGLYQLFLSAFSDRLSSLVERRLDLEVRGVVAFTPVPSPTPTPGAQGAAGAPLGAILGAIIGAVVGVTVMLAVALILLRRRARRTP